MRHQSMIEPSPATLHVELYGNGRPIVLLHGWGMHGGVFKPLGEHLAQANTVAAVDLPGHGESARYDQFADLSQHCGYLVEQLSGLLREEVTLIGWSLGGLLAQYIALQYPQYVKKLVLLCSTPCFRWSEDWSCAMEAGVLAGFAADLMRDYQTTLSRFLGLQFMGAQNQKENLRRARELVFARPQPQRDMLQQGLHLLETTDLRPQSKAIRCPTLIINAERDSLVPSAAGQYLAEKLPDARCVIIKGAGHAPFLSHRDVVTHFLNRFIHEY
jgi:pimeloyl-[acyl-carrier protein] methyl ester esterase